MQCPFAVNSGGHSSVPGGSNVDGGITISFEKLNRIVLADDKKTASFQPGNTWFDVYSALEKHNTTIIGGRVASVGVGELTLGGGISYLSSQYGLACDNVLSYEVVTASGIVLNVSQISYPDLYWALRGGGNNFGIVTQFDVQAMPQGLMWGGLRIYLESTFPALIQANYNLGMDGKENGKAHQLLSFGYSDMAIASLELEKVLTTETKDVFFEEVVAITDAANLSASISFQVFTEPILEKMAVRGGNALGLSPASDPIMNCLIALT
ncbi:hypothetical protein G6514_007807 [Epicoccum nigrum]|nr:hypothetical protein G6514_007807 [Epicoccum nigrum]